MSEFISHTKYPFLQPFVDNWKDIRDEYLQISNELSIFHQGYLHNDKWSIYMLLWGENWLVGKESALPITEKLLRTVPGPYFAAFSIFEPGCIIYPHRGATDMVLRSHLGLICPEGPWIKVNNETYHWKEGEMVVFNDRGLHEAENPSTQERVILLLDFKK